MGVVVAFDPVAWAARYPEFSYVTAAQATGYFNEATMLHRNDGGGPVSNAALQLTLLQMLTAHIAAKNAALANGQPASSLVGRISSASEGSVSVSTSLNTPAAAEWLSQTKYGLDYWEYTRQYRTFRFLLPSNAQTPLLPASVSGRYPYNV